MIKSLTVTNYLGESLKLELMRPEKSGFIVKEIEGLGPTKADIRVVEFSTNDGGLFNSARVNTRNIVLKLGYYNDGKTPIESLRQKTYRYFPLKKRLKVVIETDNREVETYGYVESNEQTIFGNQTGTQISILCPDSYLYSVTKDYVVFSGIRASFEFPFSNESLTEPLIKMGDILTKNEETVYYRGDEDIGITISIHAIGTVSGLTIYNVRTRETMRIDTTKIEAITGNGIIAGDEITINTLKGSKGIKLLRAGVEYDLLNCLDKNVDWFQLSQGDNIFVYTAEEGKNNVQFRIENKVAYEGV